MSKRNPKPLLIDMLESLDNLLEYTKNTSYKQFLVNNMLKDAVVKNVQVLGEAANKLPEELKIMYPSTEWGRIIRSRHIVIHEYFRINYDTVGRIATIHSLELKEQLNQILADLEL
jgi:uncharacterized protein with HEPN domain